MGRTYYREIPIPSRLRDFGEDAFFTGIECRKCGGFLFEDGDGNQSCVDCSWFDPNGGL